MKSFASSCSLQTPLKRSLLEQNTRNETIDISIWIGEYLLSLTLPRKTKIFELNRLIEGYHKLHQLYAPIDSVFGCLKSTSDSQMRNYWLLCEDKTLQPFQNKESFQVYYVPKTRDQTPFKLIDFQFLRCLGKGGSCAVYLVRNRRTGYLFALKQIPKEYISEYKRIEQILRQRKILSQLDANPHTILCHLAFQSQKHLNFLTDYYPGGELFFHLSTENLTRQNSKIYFCQILSSMEFLHNHNILYRDLKPQNILVDIDGHLRIADFGLSRIGFKSEQFAQSYCGSPEYMAPQMVMQSGYGYSLDFYTIGVILYEFMTGRPPYYCEDQEELLNNITTQQIYYPQQIFSTSLKSLLQKMLHRDPNKRLCSFQQIKNNPWLSDINWNNIQQRNYKSPLKLDIYSNYIHQQFYMQDVKAINDMNLLMSHSQGQPLFQFFKYQRFSSKQVLYGTSSSSTQRVITSCSQSEMKPTSTKQPKTLKPNIRFAKNIQPLKALNQLKPTQIKKKITLINTKRLSQKQYHVIPGISLSNRNSTSISKQNINSALYPRIIKSKKNSTSVTREKEQKGRSLGKNDYKPLSKKNSSTKDLLQYQSQKRNQPTVKSGYKIMLI